GRSQPSSIGGITKVKSEFERLAGGIATSQQAEIEAMQELLQTRGAPVEEEPLAPDRGTHEGH
ncbi:MAG: DUF305 domain-containing protein, partial [Actinomycetota bacterium]|nr:DUF305 domain-containing protein [Actinomycetota bacterium]